jgi:hypothetical protein
VVAALNAAVAASISTTFELKLVYAGMMILSAQLASMAPRSKLSFVSVGPSLSLEQAVIATAMIAKRIPDFKNFIIKDFIKKTIGQNYRPIGY